MGTVVRKSDEEKRDVVVTVPSQGRIHQVIRHFGPSRSGLLLEERVRLVYCLFVVEHVPETVRRDDHVLERFSREIDANDVRMSGEDLRSLQRGVAERAESCKLQVKRIDRLVSYQVVRVFSQNKLSVEVEIGSTGALTRTALAQRLRFQGE